MNYATFEPCVVETHDIDDSLLNTGLRPVPVPSKEALKKRRQRLKNGVQLINDWLDEYCHDNGHELTVRDVAPFLALHPAITGQLALFVRDGEHGGEAA